MSKLLEFTFATNYLTPFLLTELLLDVSSVGHIAGNIDFADLQGERRYGPMRAYSQSKLALISYT